MSHLHFFPMTYEVVSQSMTPKLVHRASIIGFPHHREKVIKKRGYGTEENIEIPPISAIKNMSRYVLEIPILCVNDSGSINVITIIKKTIGSKKRYFLNFLGFFIFIPVS